MSFWFLRNVLSRLGHFPSEEEDEDLLDSGWPYHTHGTMLREQEVTALDCREDFTATFGKEGQDELRHVVSRCPCDLLSGPRNDLAEDVGRTRQEEQLDFEGQPDETSWTSLSWVGEGL